MTILIGIGVAIVVLALLPSLTVGTEFFLLLDAAIAMIITLLDMGRYFIPLDVLGMCFGVILLVDMEVSIIARDCDYARYDTSAQIDRWDIVDEEAVAKESKKNLRQIENTVYKRVMAEIERRGGCSGKR